MRKLLYLLPLSAFFLLAQTTPQNDSTDETMTDTVIEQDTFDQAAAIAELEAQIKGMENKPASEIFKNMEIMGQFPAGRLLKIMEFGFSRSLGVNCTHCHDPEAWESEDLPAKQIARDMWAMVGKINGELLNEIENLQSETPVVNCTICHRGEVIPATNLK